MNIERFIAESSGNASHQPNISISTYADMINSTGFCKKSLSGGSMLDVLFCVLLCVLRVLPSPDDLLSGVTVFYSILHEIIEPDSRHGPCLISGEFLTGSAIFGEYLTHADYHSKS